MTPSQAMKHSNKLGAGAEKRKKLPPKEKVGVVMKEFKKGTLHSGGGGIVKNPKQAVAIALSEAGLSKKRAPSTKEELATEHKELVRVLKSGNKKEMKKEASKQESELKEYDKKRTAAKLVRGMKGYKR